MMENSSRAAAVGMERRGEVGNIYIINAADFIIN